MSATQAHDSLSSDMRRYLVHVVSSVALYLTAVASLAFSAANARRVKDKLAPPPAAVLVTRVTGLLGSVYVFALPLLCPSPDPSLQLSLRIPTFFYACKLLDLTVVRAHAPPSLRRSQGIAPTTWRTHASYVWKALTETRYASFDMAINEAELRHNVPTSRGWTVGPPLVLLPLAYLFPDVTELQILAGLLGLQLGIEGLHAVLHPRCPNWLFWQPFAARSCSEFWTVRWHRGAGPFLKSLGYAPARRLVGRYLGKEAGRAAGVLAAFSLSGFWHAWCGHCVVKDEHAWVVSVGLWTVFVLQGVAILAENWLLKDDKWRRGPRHIIVRVLAWAFSVETASIYFRFALPRAKVL